MRRSEMLAAAGMATGALLLAACGGGPAAAEGDLSGDKVVLGVVTDLAGQLRDITGPSSVKAVEMAVADYKQKYGDDAVAKNIEVLSADHQNKPDIANTVAREFYDRKNVDVILDVPNSAASLAIANVAKTAKKLYVNVAGATSELTGSQCNKYTFHYGYDDYMLAVGTGAAVTENGGTSWYLAYPNYALGTSMAKSFRGAIEAAGGAVVAEDPTPFPSDNYSTFLLKATTLNPKPNTLGTMHAGGDLANFVKQYNEFGLKEKGINLAIGIMFDSDIAAIGQDTLAGTQFTVPWFWEQDDKSQEWANRFKKEAGVWPNYIHAGDYSAATQYLEAVQRTGTDATDAIVGEFEGLKFEDMFARNAHVRPEDHRLVLDASLVKVKAKAASTTEGDFLELVKTIPGADAVVPLKDSTCQMS